jgi:serine/threonine protein kinase/TPR repeat protein
MEPKKIGRYEIENLLGRGGMGSVYKARDPMIGRTVAIKTINMDQMDSPDARIQFKKRFFQEAKICGKMDHPGILAIHDIGEKDGQPFIATEFIDGKQLNHYVYENHPLDNHELASILNQIAEALDFAHAHGIVHRDIKPHNIMIRRDGTIKILDFGLAKLAESEMTHLTKPGEFLGSPSYSSPEQVRGEHIDWRSDIFSFAVVAYEMISGKRPFKGENVNAVLFRVVTGKPDPIALPENIPAEAGDTLFQIFSKAMHKDPPVRFQKARDLAGELVKVIQEGDYTWTWEARTEFPTDADQDRSLLPLGGPEALLTEPGTQWHQQDGGVPPVRLSSVPITSPSARHIPGARRRKKRKTPPVPAILAASAASVALVLAAVFWWPAGEEKTPDPLPTLSGPATPEITREATPPMESPNPAPPGENTLADTAEPEPESPNRPLESETTRETVPPPKTLLTFPDPAFRDYLVSRFDRDGDGSLSTDEAARITAIDTPGEAGRSSAIRDLTGLSFFPNLTSLDCSHEKLVTLPSLPPGLRELACDGNQLSSLPVLPATLQILSSSDNRILGIDPPPASLTRMNRAGNQLRELPAMPTGLTFLDVSDNRLTTPPTVPATLERLDLRGNQLDGGDCDALAKLKVAQLDGSPQQNGLDLDCEALAASRLRAETRAKQAFSAFDSAVNDGDLEQARLSYTRIIDSGKKDDQRLIALQRLEARQFSDDYYPGMQLAGELIDRFQRAATLGDAESQYTVGFLFEKGIGSRVDPFEAKKWYERAAAQDHLAAIHNLGGIYEKGEAVPKDDERAAAYYLDAANKGHAPSQHRIGEMLRTGQGLDKADAEAVHWFSRAADQDYAPAQASLAYMYQKGLGVEGGRRANRETALYWYCRAAVNGNGQAKMGLRKMKKKIEDCPAILENNQPGK